MHHYISAGFLALGPLRAPGLKGGFPSRLKGAFLPFPHPAGPSGVKPGRRLPLPLRANRVTLSHV